MSSYTSLVLALVASTAAQSVQSLGTVGGSGATGGIGDVSNPVTYAQAFLTDAYLPLSPNSTHQLAVGTAPKLYRTNQTDTSCVAKRNVVIDVSEQGAQQEMVGFGFAWTDSAISVFNELESDVLDDVLEDLFGQSGNNMGFMRHTMGSSDLSGEQYSYDDNGPSFNLGEPDPTLSQFNLGEYGTAMAEMIAKMGAVKSDVFLFGAPWSLPGWMKNSDLFVGPELQVASGVYPYLNNSFNPVYMPQFVEYFTKYIDAFKEYGVTVNGVSLQNEPLNYADGGYPTMYLDAVDAATILNQGLGDALRERGVAVLAYDHNTDQPVYPYRVKQGAKDYVDAVAWHCYASPLANYTVLSDMAYAYPGILQFMSYLPVGGTFNWQVASNFMPAIQNGASGASMWVMATDPEYGPHSPYGGCAGCSGAIIVNSSTVYTRTNDYYMVGQFSRFIRRGAINHRVLSGQYEATGTNDFYSGSNKFYVVSVKNPDGSWAVVFANNLGVDQEVTLTFQGGRHSVGQDQFWEGTITANTVTTWLLPSEAYLNYTTSASPSGPISGKVPYPTAGASGYGTGFGGYSNSTTILGTGNTTVSACSATSTATTTSSSSSSSTVLPVPNTTHTIATRY